MALPSAFAGFIADQADSLVVGQGSRRRGVFGREFIPVFFARIEAVKVVAEICEMHSASWLMTHLLRLLKFGSSTIFIPLGKVV